MHAFSLVTSHSARNLVLVLYIFPFVYFSQATVAHMTDERQVI